MFTLTQECSSVEFAAIGGRELMAHEVDALPNAADVWATIEAHRARMGDEAADLVKAAHEEATTAEDNASALEDALADAITRLERATDYEGEDAAEDMRGAIMDVIEMLESARGST